jgi:membrane-associated phospholipid phosphatase
MLTPLIAQRWRIPVAATSALAVALLIGLAVAVHGSSTSFDDWMFRELYRHLGTNTALALLGFSMPALSVGLLGVVVLFAAMLRQWNVVALAAIGPAVAIGVTKLVLKPLIGRPFSAEVLKPLADRPADLDAFSLHGVFPSGHETAVASTAVVLVIVACRLPLRAGRRTAVIALLAAWTVLAAIGLVRNFWHYATDTVGALCVSIAVVGGTALVVDRAGRRFSSPDARSLASTSHAA